MLVNITFILDYCPSRIEGVPPFGWVVAVEVEMTYISPKSLRRSKFEVEIDLLKTLTRQGPLKTTHLMYKANVNCVVLKEYMESLIKRNLVEKRTLGKNRMVYTITDKGMRVLKHLRELENAMQMATSL